jgi:hypothetical protein
VVGLQALGDGLGLVVVALRERLAALVAGVLVLGRVELDVVDVAVGALAAAGDPLEHGVVVRLDQQCGGQPTPAALDLVAQRVGLPDRAGEAVEQEAVVALALDLGHDHLDHQLVRNEVAVAHVLLGLLAQVAAVLAVLAQHVARGDVGEVEVLAQPRGLGALAGAGRAEQEEVELRAHFRKPS